jgi:hypothetical protein
MSTGKVRLDFETVLIEEGRRAYWMTYGATIDRVLADLDAIDRAYRVPVRPWVIGECCDHIYPTCPHVVRTGRLDAKDGKWWLGRYETIDDPANVLYLDPEWDNPNGDICGWCFRVWRSRLPRSVGQAA